MWYEINPITPETYDCNALRWRHNELDGVSDHQPHDCLLNRLFGRRSKKTSKPRVTGLCVGNSPGTGEFPAQMASNAENASSWWRHHECESSNFQRHAMDRYPRLFVKLPWGKCYKKWLMIRQHWFRWWLGVVRQQDITWFNVDADFCRHMASLGPSYDIRIWLRDGVTPQNHVNTRIKFILIWRI